LYRFDNFVVCLFGVFDLPTSSWNPTEELFANKKAQAVVPNARGWPDCGYL
jgi:hypothetical protein